MKDDFIYELLYTLPVGTKFISDSWLGYGTLIITEIEEPNSIVKAKSEDEEYKFVFQPTYHWIKIIEKP